MKNGKLTIVESGLLLLLSGTIAGVTVAELNCDHTKEVCPLTAIEYTFNKVLDENSFAHQRSVIQKDYEARGLEVSSVKFYNSYAENILVQSIKTPETQEIDNQTYYSAPEGYTLVTSETGKVYCVKDTEAMRLTGECFVTTFVPEEKENGLPNEEILRFR